MTDKVSPRVANRMGLALDMALIAAAAAFIFLPEYRPTTLKTALYALFFLHAGIGTYIGWKSGWLTRSPGQIYEIIRKTGPPPRRRFENLSMFFGFVAMAIAFWS
jgi:hypothetical protein